MTAPADLMQQAPVRPLVADMGPLAPPADWYADPGLSGPTPITVTDDGRVYGHLALWETCHVSYPGRCTPPPRAPQGDYSYFHVNAVRTAEGEVLPTGVITLAGDHADTSAGAVAAMAHYADTTRAVATVRAGEDEHGIWVSGSLLPAVGEHEVAELLRAPLSGDWRVIAGKHRLIAAHGVNTPGFPIPREPVAASGAALIAAGRMCDSCHTRPHLVHEVRAAEGVDPEAIAAAVTRRLRAELGDDRLRREVGADAAADLTARAEAAAAAVRRARALRAAASLGRPAPPAAPPPEEPPAVTAAAPDVAGAAMVAVMIPAEVAEQIPVPDGGLPRGDLHVTLAYLGKDVPDDILATAEGAVRRAASTIARLSGLLGGIAAFPPGEDGRPVWVPVDVPGLEMLQAAVTAELAAAGVSYAIDHGWTPHVTLTYADPDAPLPPPVDPIPVELDAVTLAVGDQRTHMPLGVDAPPAELDEPEELDDVEAA
ncbi:2'-5' RNA ligase family protein [Bailinhaonella thermotolerans]|uniref:2'-5' RNA ligase family protein n=1 Tax=Bailinhaonella thermotolerans TaxID=1070861 RepID=UPI00192A22AB|nr:2'-5' RNA ligase family protein [Bailinhaonella thermotolerans]